jgi:hypothetical protein
VGSLGDLEHRAIAGRAALRCRAKQIAVGVGDQAAGRIGTVGDVKADQSNGSAGVAVGGLGDFKYRAVAVRPAKSCRAEQVAVATVGAAPLVSRSKLTRVAGVLSLFPPPGSVRRPL